jgi:hypothetical protein
MKTFLQKRRGNFLIFYPPLGLAGRGEMGYNAEKVSI